MPRIKLLKASNRPIRLCIAWNVSFSRLLMFAFLALFHSLWHTIKLSVMFSCHFIAAGSYDWEWSKREWNWMRFYVVVRAKYGNNLRKCISMWITRWQFGLNWVISSFCTSKVYTTMPQRKSQPVVSVFFSTFLSVFVRARKWIQWFYVHLVGDFVYYENRN